MGNSRGAKALRFAICLAVVLALAISVCPKSVLAAGGNQRLAFVQKC